MKPIITHVTSYGCDTEIKSYTLWLVQEGDNEGKYLATTLDHELELSGAYDTKEALIEAMKEALPEAELIESFRLEPNDTDHVDYRCPMCGGDHVGYDATSSWDTVKQEWVLGNTYDDSWCNDCGEVNIIQIIYKESGQ